MPCIIDGHGVCQHPAIGPKFLSIYRIADAVNLFEHTIKSWDGCLLK